MNANQKQNVSLTRSNFVDVHHVMLDGRFVGVIAHTVNGWVASSQQVNAEVFATKELAVQKLLAAFESARLTRATYADVYHVALDGRFVGVIAHTIKGWMATSEQVDSELFTSKDEAVEALLAAFRAAN